MYVSLSQFPSLFPLPFSEAARKAVEATNRYVKMHNKQREREREREREKCCLTPILNQK